MRSLYCWVVLAAASLISCGGRSDDYAKRIDPMQPASIRDNVVFIDRGRDKAYILDVGQSKPPATPVIADLPTNPMKFERRANGEQNQLLVLCGGKPDDDQGKAEPAALVILGAHGVVRKYPLASRFNAMIQSDDGSLALVFFDLDAAQQVNSLLFNPNEVQLIELDRAPSSDNPRLRSLTSLGSVPRTMFFSPAMEIGGMSHRLGVVLFDSEIAILDLDRNDSDVVTIPLGDPANGSLALSQVLFDEAQAKIYVRGSSSNDVYVVSLAPNPDGASGDFVASVNQLGAGLGPSDMVLYSDVDVANRLLVVSSGSSQAFVIDADSSRVTPIALESGASKILRFNGPKPFETESAERALLYQEGSNAVTFLDLTDLEERTTRNAELLALSQPYSRVLQLDENLVLLIHQSTGLSLLDLANRSVQPIQSANNLSQAIVAFDKLWLAPEGEQRIGFLDLERFHPSEVHLDAPTVAAVDVPSERRGRFVVSHQSSVGYITVLDAKTPDVEHAYSLRGFLVAGALEGK